jgi:hypothetical protein
MLSISILPKRRNNGHFRTSIWLQSRTTVEELFREYLRFNCPRPMRFNLTVETFAGRLVAGEKLPVYELLKARISCQLGIRGRK